MFFRATNVYLRLAVQNVGKKTQLTDVMIKYFRNLVSEYLCMCHHD